MSNSAEQSSAASELVDEKSLVGKTIDERYLVEQVLGEGGMGLVYKAKHIVLGKPLAIKVLRPDVSRDEEIIARFRQEAQSASSIGNQHIIDISDFGILPDRSTYFVMEFLDGMDLTKAIETEQPIDPGRVTHIAKQLCVALGAAHENGIVHRDLKPDNIYLIRRGNDSNFVKVLDFGIAKVGGTSSKLTRAGQVFGTPHYMSPEQCAGSGVDQRTDIYALGVILYEMVVGAVPFDADNLMGILTKHLYEEAIPPRQLVSTVPEELELVILRCLVKDADNRYQTMAELFEDLNRLELGQPTLARETTSNFMTQSGVTDAVPKKSSLLVPVLATLAAVALGIGIWFGMQPDEVDEPIKTEPIAKTIPVESPVVVPKPVDPPVGVGVTPKKVMLTSTPTNAKIFNRLGEEVCTTPCDVDRPESVNDSMRLEAKLDGYQSGFNKLSVKTGSELFFQLTPKSTARVVRRNMMRRVVAQEPVMKTVVEPPTPMMKMKDATGSSEVIDPWT